MALESFTGLRDDARARLVHRRGIPPVFSNLFIYLFTPNRLVFTGLRGDARARLVCRRGTPPVSCPFLGLRLGFTLNPYTLCTFPSLLIHYLFTPDHLVFT